MKHLITILLCLFTLFAEAQVNTNDTNKYFKSYDYGFSYKRLQAREAFIMPTDTVINKLGAVSLNGAIYLGNGIKWTSIGGGGSSTDTTSLSNRINQRIDSLRRRSDSVFARKNGVFVFQYKDSVGTTPTLQQVTNAGATSTNAITVAGLNLGSTINFFPTGSDKFSITNSINNDNILEVNNSPTGGIIIGGGTYPYLEIQKNPFVNVTLNTPSNSGFITTSVNGNFANASGNITISTGGVAVDTIFRTLGKDSIFYKKNNITYAIKDSIGTNPAPVGYYGAFQDTTTQTAASINTAYAVKLGVTDLTNGVTVANNTRIKIANAGIYNIQFSLQLEKTGGSGNMIADIWLRKNGVNLQGTTGKVVLTGSANASPVVAAWNYLVAVSSNDSLELMWATSNDNVVIKATSSTSPHPSIPSAILTVTQQSGIMAGTGISPLDTANMLSNYARTNLVNTKLNISDTTSMLSSYSTRINGKLNISDTAAQLSKYLRKTDTATLSSRIDLRVKYTDTTSMLSNYSTRINGKLNIADTSTLQPKSIPSYTFLANNTTATANAQALPFKDTSGIYTGTISWAGTAPTSGNLTYRWTRIGKMVTINISLVYANAGTTNNQLVVTLPADAPTPSKPSGLTAASNMLYPALTQINTTNQTTLTSSTMRGMLRSNAANNGFEFFIQNAAGAAVNAFITCTYFTD